MANKRIELEQYKHYVNLLQEEPNRKTVRKGVSMCVIIMMILCMGLFILSVMSNSLASNPKNVLQKPPAKSSTPTGVPNGQQLPSGTQLPEGVQIPQGTQLPEGVQIPQGTQIPEGTQIPTPTPTQTPSGSKAPVELAGLADDSGALALPAGTVDGDLLAQASTTVPAPAQVSTPSSAPTAKPKKAPLSTETKGVGNLSNLAKGAGSRGWQIYSLVLAIGLIVLLYMGMRAARLEGRSK